MVQMNLLNKTEENPSVKRTCSSLTRCTGKHSVGCVHFIRVPSVYCVDSVIYVTLLTE